jgi:hypothetical protein
MKVSRSRMGSLRATLVGLGALLAVWACQDSDSGDDDGQTSAGSGGIGGSAGSGAGGSGMGGVGGSFCPEAMGGRAGTGTCLDCEGLPCLPSDAVCSIRNTTCSCVDGALSCSLTTGGTGGAPAAAADAGQ